MKGLSLKALEAIERMIKNRFDSITLKFLGLIPEKPKGKDIVFNTSGDSLLSLFLKTLNSKNPNELEEDTLKAMMRVANNYMDSVRDNTSAKIMSDIAAHVQNQDAKGLRPSVNQIDTIIHREMLKAGNRIKLIVNAESNKVANTGTALQISKLAAQKGQDDPTVFFVVTIDDVTGPEEFVLHLLPDRKTPRVWKLSEIGAEYHKVGDPNPKLPGLHPNCRCKLTYLADGWGFDANGKVKFIGLDHNEFDAQREKYGKPR